MNQTSGRHKQLVLEAFIVGFVLAIVTHALPALQEQALLGPGRTDVSSNRTAICPKGWVIAVSDGHGTLGHAPEQLCVRLNTREQTWRSARHVCRESKGFLIKLDSILKIDNFLLADYLQQQGVDRVWTGMHHDYDRLLWDDLRPQMVKYYYGHLESTGWRKRGWRLDPSTFQNGNNTCGVLQVAGADSGEVSEETTGIRDKRSPLKPPGDGRPMPRPMFPRMGKDVPRRVDNEDLPQAKSPTQETKLENLQQFLSNQGFQEKYVESIGDSPNTGKSDKTNKPHTLDGTTTSTTTTDQSNLEDDDYHVVTKRSLSKTTTTDPPDTNTKAASGQTSAPRVRSSEICQRDITTNIHCAADDCPSRDDDNCGPASTKTPASFH